MHRFSSELVPFPIKSAGEFMISMTERYHKTQYYERQGEVTRHGHAHLHDVVHGGDVHLMIIKAEYIAHCAIFIGGERRSDR
jgi:hypothetical protein